MIERIEPARTPLMGNVEVPGDKSISHRAVLFSAMAEGTSHLQGVLDSADVRSSIAAVRSLGATVELQPDATAGLSGSVTGWGKAGPVAPSYPIDCGNSGTTVRLLLGILAGYDATVTLVGDDSLSSRPMERVTKPLQMMGARFTTAEGGTLPVTVSGAPLTGIDYASPVASAQVKSAVLLAGVNAQGRTTVREPAPSRDHTERMLPAFGVSVQRYPDSIAASLVGPQHLRATDLRVPKDPSSAAYWTVAATLVPGSRIRIRSLSMNPTRTGYLRVLERMGAQLEVVDEDTTVSEPTGDLLVRHAPFLKATTVSVAEIPSLIDEIPLLALVAARAEGTTCFACVSELRVKESDRLSAIIEGLSALGVNVYTRKDDLIVEGAPRLTGGVRLDSHKDHRLAMTWTVAGLASEQPVEVTDFKAVAVSYPSFLDDLRSLHE